MADPGDYIYHLAYFWPYLSVPAKEKGESLIACAVCGFEKCPGCLWREHYCRHCQRTIRYPSSSLGHLEWCKNWHEFSESTKMTKH